MMTFFLRCFLSFFVLLYVVEEVVCCVSCAVECGRSECVVLLWCVGASMVLACGSRLEVYGARR